MIPDQVVQRFRAVLQSKKLKYTPQRRAILQELFINEMHRECEDLYDALKRNGQNVSRATVYRTLDILQANGFARKLDLGDGRVRYERILDNAHHDHLICIQCCKIQEYLDDVIENRQLEICRSFGFKPVRHVHQIYGICQDCQNQNTLADSEKKYEDKL